MKFYPEDLFDKLEFDKLLDLIANFAYGELGKERIVKTYPSNNTKGLNLKLSQVKEATELILINEDIPMRAYVDIKTSLKNLQVNGYVLPVEEILNIKGVILVFSKIFNYFSDEKRIEYPNLFFLIQNLDFNKNLVKIITNIIDNEGIIKESASDNLALIRRHVRGKHRELDRSYKQLIAKYRKQGWLSDTVESFRNGRRVLSVPAEHKRKIKGIIHDESTTGRTSFIEPAEVIPINNDIFTLVSEEKIEIYKILKELSANLQPYIGDFHNYLRTVVIFDVILAKANFAIKLGARVPQLVNKTTFGIINAYHPLLKWKYQDIKKETVPFSLQLFGQNRILILSGPNAGGKSILLKSLGLLQLMVQSAIPVPCSDESEFGVFSNIFIDIGDQQSIENELSTYSSRLANMKFFIENTNKKTIFLIDEFGSGTDPKIGGSIAEAILFQLNKTKAFGVITTHYSNIKKFAFKTKGLLNGSMIFDQDNLSPTYELSIGKPGSSYAFEIAQKAGLPKHIIEYAKKRTGTNEKMVDQLLLELQSDKKNLENKLKVAESKAFELDGLIKTYEELKSSLTTRKDNLKLLETEIKTNQLRKENEKIESLIQKLTKEKNLEKIKERSKRKQKEIQKTESKLSIIRKKVNKTVILEKPIEVGDTIKMKNGTAKGVVTRLERNRIFAHFGQLEIELHVNEVEIVQVNKKSSTPKTKINIIQKPLADTELDIRGLSFQDAMGMFQSFMDQSLLGDADVVKIVHGKGTGVLRNGIIKSLRDYRDVKSYEHPPKEYGGDGVTLIYF